MIDDGVQRESREVDGEQYSVALMSVSQALLLGDRIIKLVGPLLEGGTKLDPEAKVTPALAIEFVSKSFSKVDGKKLLEFVGEAMKYVQLERPDNGGVALPLAKAFETHFQRRFDTLVRVLGFFLEVQYGSFFKLLEDAPGK